MESLLTLTKAAEPGSLFPHSASDCDKVPVLIMNMGVSIQRTIPFLDKQKKFLGKTYDSLKLLF